MNTALLFPGQGSQRVGMGRDLAIEFPTARRVFEEADEALGERLSRLCFEGPDDELTLTANTQPAILTNSIAVLRTLEEEKGLRFDVAAGHSLGEFTALVAAGALQFADAVALVRLRGQAMQAAVPAGEGAMAALMGLELDAVTALCDEVRGGDVCAPANLNGAGQIVVSGSAGAIDRLVAAARGKGAKRAVVLQVSAPFHCALMQPAADALAEALAGVDIASPKVPVVANVDARPQTDPARIRALLVQQVTAPVRWEQSVQYLAGAGVRRAFELGSGKVLAGLVKRIAKEIAIETIGEPHEVRDAEVG